MGEYFFTALDSLYFSLTVAEVKLKLKKIWGYNVTISLEPSAKVK